ncbi:MAG: biopolymer transporter ExbD [Actinomycetota bacterium]
MDFSMLKAEENPTRWRVSVLTRLVAVLAYAIPLIGGALSSFFLMKTFQALKNSQTAGIMAVMTALKEDVLPVTISMYLAATAGFVVIVVLIVRALIETKTASPPIWFFVLGGLLCLIPAGLFWRAEWLTVQAISPGGSIGAGGMAAVGGEIANLLLASIVSAPIVFLLLVIALAVPFKSGSKSNWSSLAGAAAIEILLIGMAVAIPFMIGEPQRKKEIVELPGNVKFADEDSDIRKDTSVILILTGDNKIYVEQKQTSPDKNEKTENPITKEELPEKLKKLMEAKTPDKRIVYLKADVNAPYDSVLQIFDILIKNDIDKVGLVAYGETKANDPSLQLYPKRFEVKLPEEPRQSTMRDKPYPLTLVAFLKKEGTIALNNEEMGSLPNLEKLTDRLSIVFKERENRGVFREGTNEIEKTVFLRVSKSSKYGDFIKLVEAVRAGGAEPIGIQFDNVNLINDVSF